MMQAPDLDLTDPQAVRFLEDVKKTVAAADLCKGGDASEKVSAGGGWNAQSTASLSTGDNSEKGIG